MLHCPIKWLSFNVFEKVHENPPLIANIVKGSVTGLREILTTESPLEKMKISFHFILKTLFFLKIF